MQEVLIFSDSHGAKSALRRVIAAHPKAMHILFCGDGVSDILQIEEEFPNRIFVSVRGNCDGLRCFLDAPCERLFSLGGLRIFLIHGHLYGVKGGYGAAAAQALKENADILIFGHTHIPYEGYLEGKEKRVHLFNPGSIGKSSGDGAHSYGVLTIGENGYLLSHGSLKN